MKLDSELMGEVICFVSQNCGLFIFVFTFLVFKQGHGKMAWSISP